MSGRGRRAGAGLTAGFVIGFAGIQLVFVLSSVVHAATWTSNNCNGDSTGIPAWKRSQAQNYAQKADHEGYEHGHSIPEYARDGCREHRRHCPASKKCARSCEPG